MKILITGAAGFIGANLCHRLNGLGFGGSYFHGIDDLSFGDEKNYPSSHYLDVVDFNNLPDEDLKTYDVLIHLATSNIIYAIENPIETVINNAVNTVELFSNFKGKIIYTSTASVYGNANSVPTFEDDSIQLSNAYDTSKRIAEQFLRERGNYTTLRLSNVYGRFQDAKNPYCGVLGKFVDKYLAGEPFTVYGTGLATRDYTYVEDVVDAIISAINQDAHNTEINIATGKETSVLDIMEMIDPNHPAEIMPERPIDRIQHRCLDISKAKRLLGWSPNTDISQGIKMTLDLKRGI